MDKENINNNPFRLGADNAVMMFYFIVSNWCNFNCFYCNYGRRTRQRKSKFYTSIKNTGKKRFYKLFSPHNHGHAFDNYSPDKWIKAFSRVPNDFVIHISGGEPFLDAENFSVFLEGLAGLDKCKLIKIFTNGFWPAQNFQASNKVKNKTVLLVSYHPTQAKQDIYFKMIDEIYKAGWRIGMINYVMEAHQKRDYDEISKYFDSKYGIFVNPNPDKDGDLDLLSDELAKYFPKLDLDYKVARKSPKGKKCFFPSIAYYIEPTGEVYRNCVCRERKNFIKKSHTLYVLKEPTICPACKCPCLDMYAFLENSGRGKKLDLLEEYIDNCKQHQNNYKNLIN